MSLPISELIKKFLIPYLLIGGLGGACLMILVFLISLSLGQNPLFADYMFWNVILLSFAVFIAALNYHIRNAFRGYKIAQTIIFNTLSTLLGIVIFSTFLNAMMGSLDKEIEEYKVNSIEKIYQNKEGFKERGIDEAELEQYIGDIRKKDKSGVAFDMFQKLIFASPFVVFVAFVLILLMHFGILLTRDRMLRKSNNHG